MQKLSAFCFGVLLTAIAGCAGVPIHPPHPPEPGAPPPEAAVGAAAFGPDERLWRLLLAGQHVYVDHSDDHGRTYSVPVEVTQGHQRTVAQAEDRPSIAVDRQGHITVLYSAEGPQRLTSYFSYSTDGGQHFSQPVLVSDHAHKAKHYQAVMTADPSGRLYFFWNDELGQDSASAAEEGAALYFATLEQPGTRPPQSRKIKDGMCNCCRLAVDMDTDGLSVVFGRFVLPGGMRDHGMVKVSSEGPVGEPWRVTDDEWQITACPMHGPALSIAPDGRYHIVWFTQGDRRRGLFYAYSDDQGKHFSASMAFGNSEAQAAHADVRALGQRVILAWKEFDGKVSSIRAMKSQDGGEHWSAPLTLASTTSAADYPFLLTDGKGIFLSWNNVERGYQLIPIP